MQKIPTNAIEGEFLRVNEVEELASACVFLNDHQVLVLPNKPAKIMRSGGLETSAPARFNAGVPANKTMSD